MENNATIYGLIFSYGMAWGMSCEGISPSPFVVMWRTPSVVSSIRERLDVGGGRDVDARDGRHAAI